MASERKQAAGSEVRGVVTRSDVFRGLAVVGLGGDFVSEVDARAAALIADAFDAWPEPTNSSVIEDHLMGTLPSTPLCAALTRKEALDIAAAGVALLALKSIPPLPRPANICRPVGVRSRGKVRK